MPTFDDLDQLCAYLQGAVNDAMKQEVFTEVKKTEIKNIRQHVYNVYFPSVYMRRGKKGGLLDPDNIKGEMFGNTLVVTNETPPNPYASTWWKVTTDKDLPEVVEYGSGYDFTGFGYEYEEPRPFMENTIAELEQSRKHISALRRGLKRQGIIAK